MASSSVSPDSLPILTSNPMSISFVAPSTHLSNRIDLRSDTVTQPTPAMRLAMAEAEVGDDVFGDDPTILKLQSSAASLLNKEAALFVPSGTMSNLIAVLSWCRERGSEVLLGSDSHVHLYEQGGIATLGSVHPRAVNNKPDGTLDLDEIKAKIRSLNDDHAPWTKLVILEQTHNRCGGTVLSVDYIDQVGKLCKENNLKLHIDGARLFNAAIALGVSAARIVQSADSISICLSKGLGAPVGSLLVGPSDFINFAKRVRKSLGGGMRQAGTIAAAGLVALTTMVDRLRDDHINARYLAESLSKLSALPINLSTVQTNLVFVPVEVNQLTINANDIIAKLRELNILAVAINSSLIRFVLHYQITKEDVQKVINAVSDIIQKHTK